MKNSHYPPQKKGFTLIEIMMALAIFAFAIVTILTALSTSGHYAANDVRKSNALELLQTSFRDLDSDKKSDTIPTPVLGLMPIDWEATPTEIEILFDADGNKVESVENAFFRCDLTARHDPASPLGHLHGRVTWPAKRSEGAPDGEVELFTSLLLP